MHTTLLKRDSIIKKLLSGSISVEDICAQMGVNIDELMDWTEDYLERNPIATLDCLDKQHKKDPSIDVQFSFEDEDEEDVRVEADFNWEGVKDLPEAEKMKRWRQQLCWDCKHAVPGEEKGCCWSREFKPVPGWDATPITRDPKYTSTYAIHYCPLFELG